MLYWLARSQKRDKIPSIHRKIAKHPKEKTTPHLKS